MPSEQLRFWLEIAASLAGLAGISAIALELLRARRADSRDFLFHTHQKFQDLYKERRAVGALEISTLDDLIHLSMESDEEGREGWLAVFNFWDLLTRTVRSNAINEKLALEHFGRPFIEYYEKFSSLHHEYIKIEDGFDWFESFDWFAEEYTTHLPGDLDGLKKGNEYWAKVIAKAS